MKKRILIKLLSAVCIIACAFGLTACGIFGVGSDKDNEQGSQGVSYGTATVNYHYEYDVIFENYWQEKYSIESGTVYDMEITYTPPVKAGYRFLGWTTEKGGEGEVVGSTYSIMGSGFGGTVYNFYAKYEAIRFEIVYHLDGGINNADNPVSLIGKQTLKNPVKDKHKFDGWYRDPEFREYTTTASMIDDKTTTVNLYAKWIRVYEIEYVSDQPNLKVVGDQSYRPHMSYTDDDEEFTVNLHSEYFKDYLFLGWEIEEGGALVKEAEIKIDPKSEKRDFTFTARYLQESNPGNTAGLRTLISSNGGYYFYAREEVNKIIVGDMRADKPNDFTRNVTVYYSGENPPEVVCRDGVKVWFEYDPEEVEKMF